MKVVRVAAPKPAEHRSIGPALHAVGAMHGYGCTSILGAETPDLTLDRRVVLPFVRRCRSARMARGGVS